MSEMVERLKFVALCAWNMVPPTDATRAAFSVYQTSPETDVAWERVIRAILEGMREPTTAMIDAGVTADHGRTLGTRVENEWRAMVDAALAD